MLWSVYNGYILILLLWNFNFRSIAETKHVHFPRQGMQIPTMGVRQNYNDDENKDILSNLPECVLLHILSFLSTKHTVQTCILSIRWKNLWKRVPAFVINYSQIRLRSCFEKFVSQFFSMLNCIASYRFLQQGFSRVSKATWNNFRIHCFT
jgi:hypothetical protein